MQTTVQIQKIIDLIEQSNLDRTIKDILIRDLKSEGLTEFLREQIIAYCGKALSLIDQRLQQHQVANDDHTQQNQAA